MRTILVEEWVQIPEGGKTLPHDMCSDSDC